MGWFKAWRQARRYRRDEGLMLCRFGVHNPAGGDMTTRGICSRCGHDILMAVFEQRLIEMSRHQ